MRLCICLLLVLALAGCGGVVEGAGDEGTEYRTEYTIELVEDPAEIELMAPVPPNGCFIGAFEYDFQLVAQTDRGDAFCAEIAERHLPNEKRLSWPPPDPLDPDGVNECVLVRGDEAVAVSSYGDGEEMVDLATRICEDFEARGWTDYFEDLPEDEAPEPEPTCVVASHDLLIELVARPAESEHVCGELGAGYLGGEAREWPPTLEGGLAAAACTAERGERTVDAMATEQAGIERLTAICEKLERDGWKVDTTALTAER